MPQEWLPEDLLGSWTLLEADWKLVAGKRGATRLGFSRNSADVTGYPCHLVTTIFVPGLGAIPKRRPAWVILAGLLRHNR